jgi:hypothetical protein
MIRIPATGFILAMAAGSLAVAQAQTAAPTTNPSSTAPAMTAPATPTPASPMTNAPGRLSTPAAGTPAAGTSAMGTSATGRSAPMASDQFSTEVTAKAHCPTDNVVWANLGGSKAYHVSGDKYFGKTKHGAYMCKKDADQSGYHASGTHAASKKPS